MIGMPVSQDFYQQVEDACRELYIRALKDIPQDVRGGLKRSYAAEESAGEATATKVMLTVLKNIELADEKDMMVCQDTGLPIYKLLVGNKLDIDLVEVKKRIRIACERATKEHP